MGALQPYFPVVVNNDGSLLPQVFTGGYLLSEEVKDLKLHAGLLKKARGRASTDHTGLAVIGGARESNNFWFAGADWKMTSDLKAQYYYGKLKDYYKQNFLGLNYALYSTKESNLKTDIRYFKTTSIGANASDEQRNNGYSVSGYTKNSKGEINNKTFSTAFIYNFIGHAIILGYQEISDNSNFVQINQGG